MVWLAWGIIKTETSKQIMKAWDRNVISFKGIPPRECLHNVTRVDPRWAGILVGLDVVYHSTATILQSQGVPVIPIKFLRINRIRLSYNSTFFIKGAYTFCYKGHTDKQCRLKNEQHKYRLNAISGGGRTNEDKAQGCLYPILYD